MDRGDVLNVYELLPRRVQRRIARPIAVVLMAAAVFGPTRHLPERAFAWMVEANTQRVQDMFDRFFDGIGLPAPATATPADKP